MEGLLMWKDVPVTAVQFSDTGEMIRYNARLRNPEYAPLHDDRDTQFLVKWWKRRSVPLSQGHVARMLEEKGFSGPEDWLCQSLGLSLTDCYWVRPAESSLRWKDVNLFENVFSEDLPEADSTDPADPAGTGSYTPNSSLQGELEKTWSIREGKRVLIKGNRGSRSTESMNEVLASLLHKKQGFDNYTNYRLLHISGRPYDYGCICRAFTSPEREFISAYDVVNSEKKRNDVSLYEHFIAVCGRHGMDTEKLRSDLEYQLLTDLILSNSDRHLNNFGVLRDTPTFRFLRLAPIFDSGKSMFAGLALPLEDAELLNLETNSLAASEARLRGYLRGAASVDKGKLLTAQEIDALYAKDTQMSAARRDLIIRTYERKLRLMEENGWI